MNCYKFYGKINQILQWQTNGDYESIKTFFSSILYEKEIIFEHPLKEGIITKCKSNKIISGFPINVLFFSDKNNNNQWCILQVINFVDGIYYNDKLYSDFTHDNVARMLYSSIHELRDNTEQFMKENLFGGLYLGCVRPNHFFHDQLVDLFHMSQVINKTHTTVCIGNNYFFDISNLIKNTRKDNSNDSYYILPNLVSAQTLYLTDYQKHTQLISEMHQYIFESVTQNKNIRERNFDLVLWLGIAGEKRSWIEQTEGYGHIINTLKDYFPSMLVIIDGMTATYGKKLLDDKNIVIAEKIMNIVDPAVEYISLAGEDYLTKISYCKNIDLFISDAGTTAIVPYHFCKKAGVLHVGTSFMPFFNPSSKCKMVNSSFITPNKAKDIGEISYSMDWTVVYNLLLDVIYDTKGIIIPKIE